MEKEVKKVVTKEDWEELFTKLANPKCTKCYGRGYIGWIDVKTTNEANKEVIKKMPKGCSAKGCSLQKFQSLQREQQIRNLKQKQEEAKKNLKEKQVKVSND